MTESEWLASDDPRPMLAWARDETLSHPLRWSSISARKLRLFSVACFREGMPTPLSANDRNAAEAAERMADGVPGAGFVEGGWLVLTPGGWLASRLQDWFDATAPAALRRFAALLRDVVGNPFRPVTLPADVITPTVTRLALAAYEERDRTCPRCKGRGDVRNFLARGTDPGLTEQWDEACPVCAAPQRHSSGVLFIPPCGTGQVDDGTLDGDRLAVLSDALLDADCPQRVVCHGCDGTGGFQANSTWVPCELCDGDDPSGWGSLPHPLLAALRSPGPHYRGFWALDLLLGKE